MDFNWAEYVSKLFANNTKLDIHQLWDYVINDLSDSEKVAAFNQGTAKNDLSDRYFHWRRVALKPVKPIYTPPTITGDLPKSVAVGQGKYDHTSALATFHCTWNPKRTNKNVPLGKWAAEDWKCFASHLYDRASGYRNQGKWSNGAATILIDAGEGSLTENYWDEMLDKLGDCPL